MALSDGQKQQLVDLFSQAKLANDQGTMTKIRTALQQDRDAAAYDPTAGSSFSDNVAEGLGSRMVKMGRAVQQGMAPGLGDPAMNPETGVSEDMPAQKAEQARQQAALAEQDRLDKPLMATGGGKVGDIAGEALPFALAPEGYLGATIAGGVSGALRPVVDGGPSKVAQIAEGAAGGAVGQAAGSLLGAGLKAGRGKLDEVATDAINVLKSHGIIPTLGQQTGRNLAPTAEAATQQLKDLTSAAMKQMGVDSERMSPKIMDAGRRRLQNTYDELAANMTVNTKDPVLQQALTQARTDADQYLTEPVAKVVQKQIDGIAARITQNGSTMNGTLFKNLHDGLDKVADHTATPIVEDLQQAMRGAMTRSSTPQQAALLAKTDQQYGAMKALEKSFGPNERIDPTKFYAATDTAQGAAASVYGRGPNAPLAQLAAASKLIMVDAAKEGLGGLTPQAIGNYWVKRAAFHSLPAAFGGYEGYQHGGSKGMLVGIALALGGTKLAHAAGSNPVVAGHLAKWANSQGIHTIQDAAAYLARNAGAQAGGVGGPALGNVVSESGQTP